MILLSPEVPAMIENSQSRSKILVTLGLCVRNSERTLGSCLESILNQEYPKELMEMIVVDGCSKDNTLSVIKHAASDSGIRVNIYSDGGKGLGAARQMVVEAARGKYIIFVDGDVELLDDFVQEQVEFMELKPNVGVAVGRYTYKEGHILRAVWGLYNQAASNEFMGNDATIYRSEALKQAEGFDKCIKGAVEDLDLTERIKAKGWFLSVNDKARFYHNSKESLRGFWDEQAWFGYGDHYFSHKYEHHKRVYPLWRKIPLASPLTRGLKFASKAYESTHLKIAFLIPAQLVFGKTAWWFGFIKSHADGYGH
jgi:glycosyltransferase involved in cell wall biosynthesis